MTNLDNLFKKNTIGFDRLFDLIDPELQHKAGSCGYPPYNIEIIGDNDYVISMAVAGFKEDEIDIVLHKSKLTVSGQKVEKDDPKRKFVHRGIAERSFKQVFELADHIKVKGANFENGILNVSLVQEIPEEMKPKKIKITHNDLMTEES